MEEEAKAIWESCSGDAEWDPYDHIDDFCWACSIYLEADGFVFEGEGQQVSGGIREIEYVDCTCPDGTVIRVA